MRYFEYFVDGDWKERFKQYPTILFITDRSKERMGLYVSVYEFKSKSFYLPQIISSSA